MITLIVDYQPFSNSRIFTTVDGKELSSMTSASTLNYLAETILYHVNQLKSTYSASADQIKIYVRAAEFFYNELFRIVQMQKQNYSNLPITMERIEE